MIQGTTDLEKLLFLYKTEGKNMSIQTFCVNSGLNYRAFDKSGQLTIDLNLFSFIRNKKSKILWSALFIGRGHQLDTNHKPWV
ncbi:hypothetical protein NG821_11955 [Prevotella cerevisiae]|jgi:hypothetical protein|uniref:Uncharacterized protein n=1 Tax=Segatella cerevisiae TaxID=2053716 RepID=A0ABT1C1Z5_9BACT|nr:hypothetical protein [Segatella cerevisiae]MCO6026538.1 hypothetical protein [Segatella cerevisiae]